MDKQIESSVVDGVLKVTLNRPEKRNPLSQSVLETLKTTFVEHADNHDIRVAVIRGAGDAAFAAGGDLVDLAKIRTEDATRTMHELGYSALEAVRSFPLPVIAALNGDALGGGAELAVAADIRIAARHARIGFLQSKLNITTAWGGATDLIDLIGRHRALQLLISAEVLSSDRAMQMGIYDACAEADDDFDDFIDAMTARYAHASAHVLRAYKAIALETRDNTRAQLLPRSETDGFVAAWVHDDHWTKADKALKK